MNADKDDFGCLESIIFTPISRSHLWTKLFEGDNNCSLLNVFRNQPIVTVAGIKVSLTAIIAGRVQ